MIHRSEQSNKDYGKLKAIILKLPQSPQRVERVLSSPIKQIEESGSVQANNACYVNVESGGIPLMKKRRVETKYSSYESKKEIYNHKQLRQANSQDMLRENKSKPIRTYIKNQSNVQLNLIKVPRSDNINKEKLSDIQFKISREVSRGAIKDREAIALTAEYYYKSSLDNHKSLVHSGSKRRDNSGTASFATDLLKSQRKNGNRNFQSPK